jgi:hypothetical protein
MNLVQESKGILTVRKLRIWKVNHFSTLQSGFMIGRNFMQNIFNILRFGGLLVFWIFIAINGSAQNGTIQGTVKDSSERPVQYVNVLLLNSSDSTLVKGMISDSLGRYLFEKISPGKYHIVASLSGMEQGLTRIFEIQPGNSETNMGTLYLA